MKESIFPLSLQDLMSLQTSAMRPDKERWTNGCATNPCSHLCLNTPLGHRCECPTGQELSATNGTDCIVPEAFMLYVSDGDISRASILTPDHGDFVLPIHAGKTPQNATRFVANPVENRIYWTDLTSKTISRAFINGSEKEVVVEFR